MVDDDIFVEVEDYKLPDPLSKEETYELFKISNLDEQSRNKIIEHNIKLVFYRIKSRFNDFDYEKKELVSIGILGLIKAVDTYDSSKGYEFTSYATRCIDNEILMFIRKSSRTINNISLDEAITRDNNDIKFEDVLGNNDDFREEIEKKELYNYLRSLIDELNERDKKIMMLYYGFYNDKCYTSNEIANIVKLSRAYVSRVIVKIVKDFGVKLEKEGLTEMHFEEPVKKDRKVIKIKSIYEYFSNYTEDEINYMISGLNDDDKKLLIVRYGDDLHNPHNIPLNSNDYNKFYGVLVKKMKRRLTKVSEKI